MTQKRFLALLLGGAVLTMSLAACGTSTQAPGSGSAPAPGEPSSAAEAPAPAESAPDAGENGSVVYFTKDITPEGLSVHHPLAEKDRLTVRDLYGRRLMLMHRGWSRYVDRLRDDLWQNHPQVKIVDFDFYSIEVFNRCENGGDVLLAVKAWENVHPLLKVIPVKWSHAIPYGLLHSPTPSKTVEKFLAVIREAVQS